MRVVGPCLQGTSRTIPWWVALGYMPDQDAWLPGGDQSYYMLSNPRSDEEGATMDDVEEYKLQAKKLLEQLEKVIVGLTRD